MSGTTIALLTLLVSSPFGGALAVRYIRPRQTQAEEIAGLRDDRAEDRAEFRRERDEDRARMDGIESQLRESVNYIYDLREHISDHKPPPPPPWPDLLKR